MPHNINDLNEMENKMVFILLDRFQQKEKIDLSNDQMAMMRIIDIVRKLSSKLNDDGKILFELPFITADKNGPKHLKELITADQVLA
ncbi:MAG: hypothetical protein APR63_10420 [Desulfuromonas sp. SDB]|nr:MAG: hypothetical protein APR63_10420 [Desulfuromonas sp. SDB]